VLQRQWISVLSSRSDLNKTDRVHNLRGSIRQHPSNRTPTCPSLLHKISSSNSSSSAGGKYNTTSSCSSSSSSNGLLDSCRHSLHLRTSHSSKLMGFSCSKLSKQLHKGYCNSSNHRCSSQSNSKTSSYPNNKKRESMVQLFHHSYKMWHNLEAARMGTCQVGMLEGLWMLSDSSSTSNNKGGCFFCVMPASAQLLMGSVKSHGTATWPGSCGPTLAHVVIENVLTVGAMLLEPSFTITSSVGIHDVQCVDLCVSRS